MIYLDIKMQSKNLMEDIYVSWFYYKRNIFQKKMSSHFFLIVNIPFLFNIHRQYKIQFHFFSRMAQKLNWLLLSPKNDFFKLNELLRRLVVAFV